MPRRADYQETPYQIPHVALYFDIHNQNDVDLKAVLSCQPREGRAGEPILLNGESIDLKQLQMQTPDGQSLILILGKDYVIEPVSNLNGEETDQTILRLLNPPPSDFQLIIHNHLTPEENETGHGLYKSGNLLSTQCESAGFRRITYFIDRPDNLATYHVTLTAPNKLDYKELLSNGNLISDRPLPDGRREVVWHDPFPKPSYLFALVTGPLIGLEQSLTLSNGHRTTARVLAEPDYEEDLDFARDLVAKSLQWQDRALGLPYDLERYHAVGVKHFTQGAMENKGLNVYNVSLMAANQKYTTDGVYEYIEHVIPHELMHNYAGNRVTIRSWHELPLKEGLATLLERLFVEQHTKSKVPRIEDVLELMSRQFKEDAGNGRKAVRPESYDVSNELYTATTYEKGAEVHYMLRSLLGEERWLVALQRYFREMDGKAITFEDYLQIMMADMSPQDIEQFTRWITVPGTPEVEFEGHYDKDTQQYFLTVRQSNAEKPFLFPLKMGLLDANGDEIPLSVDGQLLGTTACLTVREKEQTFVFTHVPTPPIPSLLRDYSAPVKIVRTPVTEAEQLFLMHHDTDPVNKALLANHCMLNTLVSLVKQIQSGNAPQQISQALLEAIHDILLDESLSPDLKSLLVTLPGRDQLIQELDIIDPEAIELAYQFFNLQVSEHCLDILFAIAQLHLGEESEHFPIVGLRLPRFEGDPLSYSRHNAGVRSSIQWGLHLYRLIYRLLFDGATELEAYDVLKSYCNHLRGLDNATLHLAGAREFLSLDSNTHLAELPIERRTQILCDQLDMLRDELERTDGHPQAAENWLKLLGRWDSPMTINTIRAIAMPSQLGLIDKRIFDMANPNMARGLIQSFYKTNPLFHRLNPNGVCEGYRLLMDYVIALDKVNHEAAGIIVRGLTDDWHKMEPNRRQQMYRCLKQLASTANLSDDILSKVKRALEKETAEDKRLAEQPMAEGPIQVIGDEAIHAHQRLTVSLKAPNFTGDTDSLVSTLPYQASDELSEDELVESVLQNSPFSNPMDEAWLRLILGSTVEAREEVEEAEETEETQVKRPRLEPQL